MHAKTTYTFFAGFIVVNCFMLLLGLYGAKYFAKISRVKDTYLIPVIFSLSVIGSYAINNQVFDVWVMFLFGLVGYLFKKFGLNPAAVVLALILGPIGETGLKRTLILSGGSYGALFTSPLSILLITLSVVSMLSPFIMQIISARKDAAPEVAAENS